MKIVLVTDAWQPQVNGVVTTLVELVAGLQQRGHAAEVIEPSTFRRFRCPGYPELELAWRPDAQVRERLKTARADAIHIATEGPLGVAARRHCLREGLAFTTAFHTRFPDILAKALRIPARWGYAWLRRFHAPAAAVMVPCEGMRGILQEHGFANTRRWSHGVDLQRFRPTTPRAHDWPRPVFLYVGRISYEKNLEAFLTLDLPGSKVVVGPGPLRERLQAAHPYVHWLGGVPHDELPAIYSAADAFVFPSRSETFGLVMLEAMACGTPVAAFPVPGPLDVVGASSGGVLDEDLRSAALNALRLSREGARARALEFDWQRVCEEFIAMLVPAQAVRQPAVTAETQETRPGLRVLL
jgi:glycosyltransferase involved in cell wall biosynthesis